MSLTETPTAGKHITTLVLQYRTPLPSLGKATAWRDHTTTEVDIRSIESYEQELDRMYRLLADFTDTHPNQAWRLILRDERTL